MVDLDARDTENPAGVLEARVALLERRLGRIRVMLLMLIGLSAALSYLVVRTPPAEISAHAFVVRDAAGRIRGAFGLAQGAVALTFYDSNAVLRADVGLTQGGTPGLLFWDGKGTPTAAFNLQTSGAPSLRLTDPVSSTRIMLQPAGAVQGSFIGLLRSDSSSVGLVLDPDPRLRTTGRGGK